MFDQAHDAAVAALPPHLSATDDGRVRCDECGRVGIRPIAHDDACSHDYTPTREGDV